MADFLVEQSDLCKLVLLHLSQFVRNFYVFDFHLLLREDFVELQQRFLEDHQVALLGLHHHEELVKLSDQGVDLSGQVLETSVLYVDECLATYFFLTVEPSLDELNKLYLREILKRVHLQTAFKLLAAADHFYVVCNFEASRRRLLFAQDEIFDDFRLNFRNNSAILIQVQTLSLSGGR